MTQEGFKRKLTAILSADVAGYSRLMESNEEATIQTLNTYRNSMSTLIQRQEKKEKGTGKLYLTLISIEGNERNRI